jgi:hypothetical protein
VIEARALLKLHEPAQPAIKRKASIALMFEVKATPMQNRKKTRKPMT